MSCQLTHSTREHEVGWSVGRKMLMDFQKSGSIWTNSKKLDFYQKQAEAEVTDGRRDSLCCLLHFTPKITKNTACRPTKVGEWTLMQCNVIQCTVRQSVSLLTPHLCVQNFVNAIHACDVGFIFWVKSEPTFFGHVDIFFWLELILWWHFVPRYKYGAQIRCDTQQL